MKRVLIYRFSAIGDVIMILPVVKGVLKSNPNAEIYLASRPFFAPIFSNIERLHFIGINIKTEYSGIGGLFKLYKKLQKEIEPDIVIDLHQVIRTQILNLFFSILNLKKIYKIHKGRSEKKKMVETKRIHKIPSTVERYAQSFKKAGMKVKLPPTPLIKIEPIKDILNKLRIQKLSKECKLVGIAPFSTHAQKIWGQHKINELIEKLSGIENLKVLLFGGGQNEISQLKQLNARHKATIVVGEHIGFAEEVKLMPHLSLMLSMDSANMHLAAISGVPVISIWGATHPALGFEAYMQNPNNIIQYEGNKINCRPCSVYGNKACLFGNDIKCMRLIETDWVFNKMKEIIL